MAACRWARTAKHGGPVSRRVRCGRRSVTVARFRFGGSENLSIPRIFRIGVRIVNKNCAQMQILLTIRFWSERFCFHWAAPRPAPAEPTTHSECAGRTGQESAFFLAPSGRSRTLGVGVVICSRRRNGTATPRRHTRRWRWRGRPVLLGRGLTRPVSTARARRYPPGRRLSAAGNFAGSIRDRALPAASRTRASRSRRASCSAGTASLARSPK